MSRFRVQPAISTTFTIEHGERSEPGLPGSKDDDRDSELSILDPMTGRPLPVVMADPRTLGWNPVHPPPAHDARYLAGLDVMRERGVRLPIAVRQDGVILDGHRRVATALELGLPEVPVVVLDALRVFRAIFRGWRLEIQKTRPSRTWTEESPTQ